MIQRDEPVLFVCPSCGNQEELLGPRHCDDCGDAPRMITMTELCRLDPLAGVHLPGSNKYVYEDE
jgi:hypothetical protein